MKAILMPQFVYCPPVRMNHNRSLNNPINSLHERGHRIIYNDYKSSFHQLLGKDNSVTISVSLSTRNYEVCIRNYEVCIQNCEVCIRNYEVCIRN